MAPTESVVPLLVSLLLLPLLSHGAKSKVYIAQIDRQPLTNVMKGFGANATRLKNWNFKYECKAWEGVTCDSTGRVTSLSLSNKKFSSISSSIGNLTALTSLILYSCSLKGRIPSTIGRLSKLAVLSLQSNDLSGFIPEEMYKCTKLESLLLGSNRLYGPISPRIAQLTKINAVDISGNYLSGGIPPLASSIKKMDQFSANGNYFNYNDLNVEINSRENFILYNCLINLKPEIEFNRPEEECAAFCNAGSSRGPCEGYGYCYFDKSKPKCLCNTGYKPKGTTCIKG